jgi:hypothetical protein
MRSISPATLTSVRKISYLMIRRTNTKTKLLHRSSIISMASKSRGFHASSLNEFINSLPSHPKDVSMEQFNTIIEWLALTSPLKGSESQRNIDSDQVQYWRNSRESFRGLISILAYHSSKLETLLKRDLVIRQTLAQLFVSLFRAELLNPSHASSEHLLSILSGMSILLHAKLKSTPNPWSALKQDPGSQMSLDSLVSSCLSDSSPPDGLFDWELDYAEALVSCLNQEFVSRMLSHQVREKIASLMSAILGSSLLDWARGVLWYMQDPSRLELVLSARLTEDAGSQRASLSPLDEYLDRLHRSIKYRLPRALQCCVYVEDVHSFLSSNETTSAIAPVSLSALKKRIYSSLLQLLFLSSQPRVLSLLIDSTSAEMRSNLVVAFEALSEQVARLSLVRESPDSLLPPNSLSSAFLDAISGKHAELKWKSFAALHSRLPRMIEELRNGTCTTTKHPSSDSRSEAMQLVLQAESDLAKQGFVSPAILAQLRLFLSAPTDGSQKSSSRIDSILDLLTPSATNQRMVSPSPHIAIDPALPARTLARIVSAATRSSTSPSRVVASTALAPATPASSEDFAKRATTTIRIGGARGHIPARFRPPVVAAGVGASSPHLPQVWPYYSSRQLELLSEWLLKAGNEVASNDFVKVQISESPNGKPEESVASPQESTKSGGERPTSPSQETILKGRKRIKSLF